VCIRLTTHIQICIYIYIYVCVDMIHRYRNKMSVSVDVCIRLKTHIQIYLYTYICVRVCASVYIYMCIRVVWQSSIGRWLWQWWVGSLKIQVSFPEYSLFYRALVVSFIGLTKSIGRCFCYGYCANWQGSFDYGVATGSRLLKIMDLFCRI